MSCLRWPVGQVCRSSPICRRMQATGTPSTNSKLSIDHSILAGFSQGKRLGSLELSMDSVKIFVRSAANLSCVPKRAFIPHRDTAGQLTPRSQVWQTKPPEFHNYVAVCIEGLFAQLWQETTLPATQLVCNQRQACGNCAAHSAIMNVHECVHLFH